MKQNKWETVRRMTLNMPLYIMTVFTMIHLGIFIEFDLGGKIVNLSFVNQIVSFLYLAIMYFWAIFVNKKTYVKVLAVIMGALSACGILISLNDFGKSVNDLLFAGTSVLTIFFVFDNAEYLLGRIKVRDKYLTVAIWSFVVFSVFLFVFFPNYQTQWGKGVYFYGHRYASVCGLAIMLIGLKLTNRPKHAAIYWLLLFVFYYLCFWTGARVYMISNLGQVYALLFVFRRSNKDFILKCVAVTLAALLAFMTSSAVEKIGNIINSTNDAIAQKEEAEIAVDETYEWVNSISNGRWEIWDNCIHSYKVLPVFNKLVGSGNKYIYENNILPYNHSVYAHTDFLNILHFNGLIGLIVYLAAYIGYVAWYWRTKKLSLILLIGFWGVWFVLALLNGYGNYTANMMSLPYLSVMALWEKENCKTQNTFLKQ